MSGLLAHIQTMNNKACSTLANKLQTVPKVEGALQKLRTSGKKCSQQVSSMQSMGCLVSDMANKQAFGAEYYRFYLMITPMLSYLSSKGFFIGKRS